MLDFVIAVLSAFLVAVVGVTGLRLRARMRRRPTPGVPQVDDEAVGRILDAGVIEDEADEPLDQAEIDEEERRFWSEPGDEPEES